MASWGEFAALEPELASVGRRLLFQFGPGLAFIATISRTGDPRLHPITIALTEAQLYAFIVTGPKQHDLERDGRYAMHAFLPEEVEEEFMIAGRAELADSPAERQRALTGYHLSRAPDDHRLFRFDVERALHAAYRYRGDWPPVYRRWKAVVEAA